jgi:hypothetical protein
VKGYPFVVAAWLLEPVETVAVKVACPQVWGDSPKARGVKRESGATYREREVASPVAVPRVGAWGVHDVRGVTLDGGYVVAGSYKERSVAEAVAKALNARETGFRKGEG